jgi:hypothetical protein
MKVNGSERDPHAYLQRSGWEQLPSGYWVNEELQASFVGLSMSEALRMQYRREQWGDAQ